jgi:RimJ/RimL family protein N-acetyltransferase
MALPKPTVYRIETARLVIRCWEPRDAPLLNASLHASWDHLTPWMPWARGEPATVDQTAAILRRWRGEFDLDQDYVYAIFDADETIALGSTGLHTRGGSLDVREIGYWIHVDHLNQGYATEASAALTRVAFEQGGMRRVEIHCLTDNVRSAAVPRKLAFTHEATRRELLYVGEHDYRDGMIWTMLASEYPGSPASQTPLAAYDALGRQLL